MIIVTGADGFIGSNLVRKLNRRGRTDLLAIDDYPWLRGSLGETHNAAGIRYAEQMNVAGYLDMFSLPMWLDRNRLSVEAVIHLGACSDTMATDRRRIMTLNYAYTQHLWRWCARTDRPFVYASSAATYGDGSSGYDDNQDPAIYHPLNLYAESKQAFDLWALHQLATPPRWTGLKYFNVYGPHETHKGRMASVVYHGFHQIRQTGQVQLFKSHRDGIPDGGQMRDFVYVGDAVDATLHFLDTPNSPTAANGLYNIGTGQARTFADLGNAIFVALSRKPRIVYTPMPEALRSRYQYWTQATTDKLRNAGFAQPMRSLEEGVREYVQNFLLKEAIAA